MNPPPTILIRDTNFSNAYARSVRYVLREGVQLTIGDIKNPKDILDACMTIELTGDAVRQVENREIHDDYPFRHINEYCDEFTRDYQEQYLKLEENERFVYTYIDRLVNYDVTNMGYTRFAADQIKILDEYLADQIHNEITSNRDQAITWQVSDDLGSDSPPCLQRVLVRHLGDGQVDVHFDWRSRDGYTAWQANVIALVDMLNREVVKPNGCRIVKIVDYSDSWHIYKSDVSVASDVKLVPVCFANFGR